MCQYVIFRRGIGLDCTSNFFFMEKVDMIIARAWRGFLEKTRYAICGRFNALYIWSCSPKILLFSIPRFRLQKLFSRKKNSKPKIDSKKNDDLASEIEDKELYVERIRLEIMKLRFALFFNLLLSCHTLDHFLSWSYSFLFAAFRI